MSYKCAVFSLAFFSMAGRHAVNQGRYAVLKATTLSFEQRGGSKSSNFIYSTFINAIYRGVTWRSNTIWLEQLYIEPGWGGGGDILMRFSIPVAVSNFHLIAGGGGGGGAKRTGAAGFTATL